MYQLFHRLRELRWKLVSGVFKLLLSDDRIRIGRDLRCEGVPDIRVSDQGRLEIGDGVLLRRGVELRVTGNARLSIGNGVKLDRGVRIIAANDSVVEIGEGTGIGLYSVFNGGDSIRLGRKCLISGYVYLQSSMHRHLPGEFIRDQGFDHAPVEIGDDVWLGAHCVVLPGVRLGEGAICGSNAVVTRSFEAGEIVAGVPAKVIGARRADPESESVG